MFKRVLTYFLLALIVLQSSVAMGDAHQLHQSGTEHVVFDNKHAHFDGLEAQNHDADALQLGTVSHHASDCDHCCHCHGHYCSVALMSLVSVIIPKIATPIPSYSENAFTDSFDSFLRPPRA